MTRKDGETVVFCIYYGDHTITLEFPVLAKACGLKDQLTRHTGLIPSDIELLGWDISDALAAKDTFADVGAAKENHLVLQALNGADPEAEIVQEIYHLHVNRGPLLDACSLFFNGLQTVRDVQLHVAMMHPDLEVHLEGWPGPVTDDLRLFDIDRDASCKELCLTIVEQPHVVTSLESTEPQMDSHMPAVKSIFLPTQHFPDLFSSHKENIPSEVVEEEDLSYDSETFDCFDDFPHVLDTVISEPSAKNYNSKSNLLPLDSAQSALLFQMKFEQRYGCVHPEFFRGSLDNALNSWFDEAKKRYLFVYLHHDRSVCVNIFVTNILQQASFLACAEEHSTFVPVDITQMDSRIRAEVQLKKHLGKTWTPLVFRAEHDSFPLLLLFKRRKASATLLKVIDGSSPATDVMVVLHTVGRERAAAVYQAEVHEIDQFLYLSGASGVRRDYIRERAITCIINCTVEFPNLELANVEFYDVKIDDSPYALIGKYFDFCADKIEEHRLRGGKVLVHCMAGVSRSASIVIAYLVRHRGMSLRDAYMLVRRKRSIIRPNVGFWKQLIEYEQHVRNHGSVKMVPSAFGWLPDVYEEECKPLSWVAIKSAYRI